MDRTLFGPILRKERLAQGITIAQVADQIYLSQGTVSNIERGLPNVSEEKYIEYAKFLGKEEELFGIVSTEKQKERQLRQRLKELEYIAAINPKKTLAYLKEIQQELVSEKNSPLSATIYYLNGVCHYTLRKWKSATNHFQQSLDFAEKNNERKQTNLVPACYNYLGLISYFDEYNLIKALEYTQKGIDSIILDGDRIEHYFVLLANKPIFLEVMNLNGKALQATKELETAIKNAKTAYNIKTYVLILVQDLYSSIYKNLGLFEEALPHAFQGVRMAWVNKQHDQLFSLWTTIGMIYYSLDDKETAKTYYQLALDIEQVVTKKSRLAHTYSKLSEMLLNEGDWEKSKEFALKSIDVSQNHPMKKMHLDGLIALGKWHLKREEYSKALEIFSSAETFAHEHQLSNELTKIVANMGTCYKELGDQQASIEYTIKLYQLTEK